MVDEKNPFRTHKKALVDTAFETLLTSHWVSDLDLSEQACRKIFSDIFTQIENDLFSENDQPGYYLSRYYLDAFQAKSELKQNFYAQLAFLGIARIIINHFLIHHLFSFLQWLSFFYKNPKARENKWKLIRQYPRKTRSIIDSS